MGTVQTVSQRVVITAEQAKAFLASPTGVKFRRYAGGVIVLVPMLFRLPGVRRYPLFRALEAIGGVALVIKAAEAIRDWDANGRTERADRDRRPAGAEPLGHRDRHPDATARRAPVALLLLLDIEREDRGAARDRGVVDQIGRQQPRHLELQTVGVLRVERLRRRVVGRAGQRAQFGELRRDPPSSSSVSTSHARW